MSVAAALSTWMRPIARLQADGVEVADIPDDYDDDEDAEPDGL